MWQPPTQMRDRITIQKEIDNPVGDGGGGQPTWKDTNTVWANVSPVSSNVRIQTMTQADQITHKITIRYIDYLDTQGATRYRILFNGNAMRIVGPPINPDQVRRYLEITAVLGQMVGQ